MDGIELVAEALAVPVHCIDLGQELEGTVTGVDRHRLEAGDVVGRPFGCAPGPQRSFFRRHEPALDLLGLGVVLDPFGVHHELVGLGFGIEQEVVDHGPIDIPRADVQA